MGIGNCHDPKIGGNHSEWKVCCAVWINFDGTPDMEGKKRHVGQRCICNPIVGQTGPLCDGVYAYGLAANVPVFAVILLIDLAIGFKCLRLTYYLLVIKKWKPNAAMIALFFVFVAVVNDGIRHLMMIWVTIPAGDLGSITADEYSLSLQTALPITVMTITQGLLGLSVTWLEIGE